MNRLFMLASLLLWGTAVRADDPKGLPIYDEAYTREKAEEFTASLNKDADRARWMVRYDQTRAKEIRKARLTWQREQLVVVFEKSGNTSAPWAAKARAALEARAAREALSVRSNSITVRAEVDAVHDAVAAGCDDPMVLFLHAQASENGELVSLLKAGEGVYASRYPAVQKLLVAERIVTRVSRLSTEEATKAAATWRPRFLEQAKNVATSNDPLAESELLLAAERYEAAEKARGEPEEQTHQSLLKAVGDRKETAYVRGVLDGVFYTHSAWAARGRGPAVAVTAEGAKMFMERLEKAHASLTAAWDADDSRTEAPTRMITLCMGQGKDRPTMERWYRHAMTADPDNAFAVRCKLEFLTPKWHGSSGEYTLFAWQIIKAGNWDGWVGHEGAFHFLQSYGVLTRANHVRDETAGENLKRDVVWHIVVTALTRHLAANPTDDQARTYLARFAIERENIPLARAMFNALPMSTDFIQPFGTKERFDEARRLVGRMKSPNEDKR